MPDAQDKSPEPEGIGDVQGPDYGWCRCDGGRCGHPASGPDGFCSACREPGLNCIFFQHGTFGVLP